LGKAIIFGANGQDGFYLSELLLLNKIEPITISRTCGTIIGDVSDFTFIDNTIKILQPNYVFHFAANSTTKHSALRENHNSISSGTLNILEAVRKYSPNAKVFISGSAMQFKNDGNPINESTPFEASSAYSAERIYSVYLARYYREKFQIKTYIGYLFNHDSPLRSEFNFSQKIIKIANDISKGKLKKIDLGNLNIKKEFNFAGDIVNAIWVLINQEVEFEVVIGSGTAYPLGEWVNICFQKFNINQEEHILQTSNIYQEYDILVSNPKKIYKLGWSPILDITQLAKLMLEKYLLNEQ